MKQFHWMFICFLLAYYVKMVISLFDCQFTKWWLLLTTTKSTLQVDKLNGNNIFRLFIRCNGSRHCEKLKQNRDGCTHFADSYMVLNMDMKCANSCWFRFMFVQFVPFENSTAIRTFQIHSFYRRLAGSFLKCQYENCI